ncbi:MAG: PP2C family protein-serine/threonine phosphatase [Bacteroidota bacterium]
MNQHRLYRTIEALSNRQFRTDDDLLRHVVGEIIRNEEIPVRGGRIWKLEGQTGRYRLLHQEGEIEPIRKSFRLDVLSYPMFLQLPRKGTVVAAETDRYLRRRGIRLYSATGAGEKVRWKEHILFPYVIAINADYLREEMAYALNIIGNALTSALRNRKIERKARQLEQDLDKAREIQKSILPAHELRFHHFDIYGVSLPDRVVGGDFFDYLQASEDKDRLGVVIGDAASKGLSAAAQALYVSGALRMGVEYQTKISTLIGRINRLVNRTFSPEHFVSLVYLELGFTEQGLLFYVNAGHNSPIILRAATGRTETLPATGQIIGPFPQERYRTEFALLEKGDILLLYTDGVSDASDENREMYGERRLMERLREWKARSPREICQLMLEDVQKHNRLTEFSDDKTLVVIKRSR